MSFFRLLGENRNYRYTWIGQVVSEVGDHFNNIAVFALAMKYGEPGPVLSAVLIARGLPMLIAGPLAGVILDRFDRKRVMIASDLIRGFVAALFVLCENQREPWLLYVLSAVLMFASPFFTAGRAAILPVIATRQELHIANSVTITTQWTNTAIGAFLGGMSVHGLGYGVSFFANAMSFFFSAWCIQHLRVPQGFRAHRHEVIHEGNVLKPWHDYADGLRYLLRTPLILAIALIGVGWALGGGAAQILFSLFGEVVYHRGAQGIGVIWATAGLGLVCGGFIAHWIGKRLSFEQYKWTVPICYTIHGAGYVLFSQIHHFGWALIFIAVSRMGTAVSSILNNAQILRHVPDAYRGRVFSTMETITWSMMMVSLMVAGVASLTYTPRQIGTVVGALSFVTVAVWAWANATGRLPEPPLEGVPPEEVEIHGEPA